MHIREKDNITKGFTLAELLIVVAIIGVLVAVSIPIFSLQMDKAKIAANHANIRAAKAAAISDYMGNDAQGSYRKGNTQGSGNYNPGTTYYCYDISSGKFITDSSKVKEYPEKKNGVYTTIIVNVIPDDNDDVEILTTPHYVEGKDKLDEAIVFSSN